MHAVRLPEISVTSCAKTPLLYKEKLHRELDLHRSLSTVSASCEIGYGITSLTPLDNKYYKHLRTRSAVSFQSNFMADYQPKGQVMSDKLESSASRLALEGSR